MYETLIILGLLLFIFVTGSYLATTLTVLGLAVMLLFTDISFVVIGNGIWNILNSYSFAAIPLYFLLGSVISVTGIAQRIYGAVTPLFGRLPGGLLQSNIGTCALFAAISGSSTATTAAIGSIAYNELEERGYSSRALIGSLAGGGTLGILIPPSTILIVYGALQNVSIGKLFAAGIIPGVMISLAYMVYIGFQARSNPEIAPVEPRVPILKALKASIQAWPLVILMLAILGTVFLGLATATEAAAIGVVAALALAAGFKRLSLRAIWEALTGTMATFSSLTAIFVGAIILAQAVAFTGLPDHVMELIQESGLGRYPVVILILLLYLVMGCFFEPYSIMFITLPVVFPIIIDFGFDPVWFGIAMVMVIEVALLTPPLGMNLFVLMALSEGRHSLMESAVAVVPYWLILLLGLVVVTIFPGIVLWLPGLYGS